MPGLRTLVLCQQQGTPSCSGRCSPPISQCVYWPCRTWRSGRAWKRLSHRAQAAVLEVRQNPGHGKGLAADGATSKAEEDCETAGGCLSDWMSDSGFWDNPSPVRQKLLELDPGLNQALISSATTVAQIFNQDMWEKHRKTSRYITNLKRVTQSTVFRRILPTCLTITAAAVVVTIFNLMTPANFVKLSVSLVPHTLLGAALSLLLVFRTNASFHRFTEGRALWGQLVRCSRDWTRLAASYFPKNLKKRAARYVQVLAFVLKARLRAGRTRLDPRDPTAFRDDPTHVVHELLPTEEANTVLQQANKPFFVVCRMTQILKEASADLPPHVLHLLDMVLSDMLNVCGGCDRILGTPIPLSYTRHTSRSLMLWLMTLPLALWPCMGLLTVPAIFAISFIFLGIDEIGVEIEEPFCILPLLPMCRTIADDVNVAMSMTPCP